MALRAAAYGMPGCTIDGNDPVAVYGAAKAAVARARAGEGPTLIEAMTYRFWGHIFGDDMRYMPAAERQAAMDADPAVRYRNWLAGQGYLDEAALAAVEADVDAAIEDAMRFALGSPPPGPAELFTDVYSGEARPA